MIESNQRSETSETNEAPQSDAAELSGRAKLDALLSEGESQSGDAGESQENAEPKAGEPKGKPKSLKDAAERLGVSDADLYAIEVPMADGKTMPLGKLKDAAAKQDELSVRELAFTERVAKHEAEWTREQTEFHELVSSLGPAAIKPEFRAKIAAKVAADARRENELTIKAIPQWQDATVRDAELVGMVEHLADFGIHGNVLASVGHKMRRLMRQAFLDRKRIRDAAANVTPVKRPSTTGKSAAGNGAPRKPQTASQTRGRETARDRLNKLLA